MNFISLSKNTQLPTTPSHHRRCVAQTKIHTSCHIFTKWANFVRNIANMHVSSGGYYQICHRFTQSLHKWSICRNIICSPSIWDSGFTSEEWFIRFAEVQHGLVYPDFRHFSLISRHRYWYLFASVIQIFLDMNRLLQDVQSCTVRICFGLIQTVWGCVCVVFCHDVDTYKWHNVHF